tara:strand:- start:1792 stop:1986 length:195 start_codon:yes stop_codon:yes gene_type:complete
MKRLSDRIVHALELAVEQGDSDISLILAGALELALTRQAGGQGFSERRSYSDALDELMTRAKSL